MLSAVPKWLSGATSKCFLFALTLSPTPMFSRKRSRCLRRRTCGRKQCQETELQTSGGSTIQATPKREVIIRFDRPGISNTSSGSRRGQTREGDLSNASGHGHRDQSQRRPRQNKNDHQSCSQVTTYLGTYGARCGRQPIAQHSPHQRNREKYTGSQSVGFGSSLPFAYILSYRQP